MSASSRNRLPWFKCEPGPFLNALARMPGDAQHVYFVVILQIYEHGGAIRDDVEELAHFCRRTVKATQAAVDRLVEKGYLQRGDGRLSNARAEAELTQRAELSEVRAKVGRTGGERSGSARRSSSEKDEQNQQSAEAIASALASNANQDLSDKKREEEREEQVARARVSAPAPAPAPAREATPVRPGIPERMHPRLLAALPEGVSWPVVTSLNVRPILECLNGGADFERHVLPTVASYGRQIRGAGKKIFGWEEVARQIMAVVERERAPAPATPVETVPDELWSRAVAHYRRSGEWMLENRSTPPDSPRTRVPAAILAEHGYGPPPASPEITAA